MLVDIFITLSVAMSSKSSHAISSSISLAWCSSYFSLDCRFKFWYCFGICWIIKVSSFSYYKNENHGNNHDFSKTKTLLDEWLTSPDPVSAARKMPTPPKRPLFGLYILTSASDVVGGGWFGKTDWRLKLVWSSPGGPPPGFIPPDVTRLVLLELPWDSNDSRSCCE